MEYKVDNDFRLYNSNYIVKSDINRKLLDKYNFPKSVSVKDVKNEFNNCFPVWKIVGNKYNTSQQRHVAHVHLSELYKRVVKK